MAHEISPITINGVDFATTVSDEGTFQSSYKGETFTGYSKGDVRDKLETAMKRDRLRISVPFVRLTTDGRIVQCEVTGKHAGNGNWLVNVGSKTGEQERWMDRKGIRPLSPDERAELKRLAQAREAAKAAVTEFTEARQFDLRDVVNKAWQDAER